MATSVHMYVQKKIESLKTKYNGMKNTNKINEHHQISDHLIWATFKGHFNSLAKKHSTFDQKNSNLGHIHLWCVRSLNFIQIRNFLCHFRLLGHLKLFLHTEHKYGFT